jgi:stalled ribosome alternative rescue factor ArfA
MKQVEQKNVGKGSFIQEKKAGYNVPCYLIIAAYHL